MKNVTCTICFDAESARLIRDLQKQIDEILKAGLKPNQDEVIKRILGAIERSLAF